MFGVLSAVALVGLIAVAIPIIIHLINPGKGKLVWVGNIELLKHAKKHKVQEYRISQWLLLLLRILLLVLLTLLVAKAYFKGPISSINQTQILVTEPWLAKASEQQRKNLGAHKVLQSQPVWPQLADLDRQQPPHIDFEVYATDAFAEFDGPGKPTMQREVRWHMLATDSAATLPLTISRTVTVYSSARHPAVSAALQAIKVSRLPNLTINWQRLSDVPSSSDWFIYLENGPLPQSLLSQAANGATVLHIGSGEAKPRGNGYIVPFSLSDEVDFAHLLLDKLTLAEARTLRFSSGTMSQQQIQTAIDGSAQNNTPLTPYLLVLLVLCFIAERYLAERPGAGA